MKKIFSKAVASLVGFSLPALALAQDYNYDYNYDYNAELEGLDTAATAVAGVTLVLMIVFGFIGFLLFVFEIWMIIDAAKRDFDQKAMWIILMVILGPILAIIYYFAVKRKNVTGSKKPVAGGQTPPAQQ